MINTKSARPVKIADLHIDPIIQHFLFDYDVSAEYDQSWRPHKRRWLFDLLKTHGRLRKWHRPFFNHIDLPRMQKGQYGFAAFGIHAWPVRSEKSWQFVLRQLDYFNQLTRNPAIELVRNPRQARDAIRAGQLAVFPAVEGLHCLGESGKSSRSRRLNRLEFLREKYGVGYVTLAHFSKNDAVRPAMGLGANPREGLTSFGKAVVHKMNEVGIIIDVAHVNTKGVLDVCALSRKPVIVSHTGLKGVYAHARNLADEALQSVAETGGVVGVMLGVNFLCGERNASSDIVMEHIDYIVQKVGEDYAAIGSDFDGWLPRLPIDVGDASAMPVLLQKMRKLGYSETRIKKIAHKNFFRVWQEVSEK